ncbi:MAG: hypothetical protein EOO41_02350, partial [Methanobacteriota archaeon]
LPPFAFAFVEGALVSAVRQGHWVLLDEINLAAAETLQRLAGLLDGSMSRFTLSEKGSADALPLHDSFRLFAAMNPATDVGKRDLPPAFRNRFTELYVNDVEDRDDVAAIVHHYCSHIPQVAAAADNRLIDRITDFYLASRQLAAPRTTLLRDGAGGRPHYSVRSLTRALRVAAELLASGYPVQYAMREGMSLSFIVQLDAASGASVTALLDRFLPLDAATLNALASGGGSGGGAAADVSAGKKRKKGALEHAGSSNSSSSSSSSNGGSAVGFKPKAAIASPDAWVSVAACWLPRGDTECVDRALPNARGETGYVLVPSVEKHLHNLARAVMCGRFPVLLQGPTSSGKTSMVEYLAALTGHTCVRINNHEHTDLAEYIGTYMSDSTGRLTFVDGLLVSALRRGHWIILDELNLAPSEVLEALNRLLDDNRELFIPDTQEIVKPHPAFMLFATQNPAGLYGGRKQLSQAFRNRFVELHVDDIPEKELEIIISRRSALPASFVTAMVTVSSDLHKMRQASDVFAGKHGFITTRDLLRWASRRPDTYQRLAEEGFMLLAERLRNAEEQQLVASVLHKHCKTAIDTRELYTRLFQTLTSAVDGAEGSGTAVPHTKRRRVEAAAAAAAAAAAPQPVLGDDFNTWSREEFEAATTSRLH